MDLIPGRASANSNSSKCFFVLSSSSRTDILARTVFFNKDIGIAKIPCSLHSQQLLSTALILLTDTTWLLFCTSHPARVQDDWLAVLKANKQLKTARATKIHKDVLCMFVIWLTPQINTCIIPRYAILPLASCLHFPLPAALRITIHRGEKTIKVTKGNTSLSPYLVSHIQPVK